ncbi:MAG: ferrous iron transport protein B [bacterium]
MRDKGLPHRSACSGSAAHHRDPQNGIESAVKEEQFQGEIRIALVGNPNAGKTTLFNALTGAHQKVGNWPGVTVEKKEGVKRFQERDLLFTDLPGTYSLTAYSLEEVIVRDFLFYEKPDLIVQVVDGSNLERNLYLTVQLIELGIPLVIALNMYDELLAKGFKLNADLLGQLLGCRIVPTVGSKSYGLPQLLTAIIETAAQKKKVQRTVRIHYGLEFEEAIGNLEELLTAAVLAGSWPRRWFAIRLLEGDNDALTRLNPALLSDHNFYHLLELSVAHLEKLFPEGVETVIADRRYGFIAGALQETLQRTSAGRREITEQVDTFLTHRLLGMPLFLFFLWLLFQATFTLGAAPMGWIEAGSLWLGSFLQALLPPGPLNDLIVDGIIGGVGGVLVFLPNILILFLGISILEDTGYMARAAFLMDRLMHSIGLHGKSFIPLIMGFGCGVPAIIASRTLENRRDRLLTILITPLMSCSARLPVYILFAGAFLADHAGNVIFGLYLFGVVMAIMVGKVFAGLLFRAKGAPFVMELPPYRIPTVRTTLRHMWDRASQYLRKMGTVILAASVIIWFAGAFPRVEGEPPSSEQSYIGQLGQFISPVLTPLDFTWQMGVSLLTGLVAKEVVVSSMGVLYEVKKDDGVEGGQSLTEAIHNSGITPISALAFMLFVLLYTPCLAAIICIWRETGSWAWTLFSVGYQTTLAWIIAFLTVNFGKLLGWGI